MTEQAKHSDSQDPKHSGAAAGAGGHGEQAKGAAATPKEPYFPPPAGFDPPPPAVIPGQETDPAGVIGLMEGGAKSKASEGAKEDPKHEDPKHSGKS